ALGGLLLTVANGATKQTSGVRRLIAGWHGASLFLVLLGGFGALARLNGGGGLPGWVIVKLVLWLALAAIVALPYRRPELARPLFWLLPVVGGVAVYMALYKPF
ncbi:MAG TPA: hypothetical protein VFX50_03615, partial [Gemmatimonadales bacterium]|nr:hypothetical protein [Gemmatimonadales bacterium]